MCDVVYSLKCKCQYKLNFKLSFTQTMTSNLITKFALIAFKWCWQNLRKLFIPADLLEAGTLEYSKGKKSNHHNTTKFSGLGVLHNVKQTQKLPTSTKAKETDERKDPPA